MLSRWKNFKRIKIYTMENTWIIEYSQQKEHLRIAEFLKTLSINRHTLKEGTKSDYLIIGIYDNYREASDDADLLTKELNLSIKSLK